VTDDVTFEKIAAFWRGEEWVNRQLATPGTVVCTNLKPVERL